MPPKKVGKSITRDKRNKQSSNGKNINKKVFFFIEKLQ
jgi:hypothetical protein